MTEWESAEIPKILYKYRDWKNDHHKKIILNQEIFIPSPRSFNDPFDCKIPIAFHLRKNDDELAIDFIKQYVRRVNNYSNEEFEIEVERIRNEALYKDSEHVEKLNKQSIEELHSMLGVYSMTAVNDNIPMWAHYSNNHQGFCIGFDSLELLSFLECAFGEIKYRDEYPTILPTKEIIQRQLQQILTKASYWDYEIEYRLFKDNSANTTIKLPVKTIKEIILGYKMSSYQIKEIFILVEAEMPHVRIFQTVQKKRSFEFEIKEIKI